MKKENFFTKRENALTLAFLIIMLAFFVMIKGIGSASTNICGIGFGIAMLAMLYSPFEKYVLRKKRKNKNQHP